MTIRSLVLLFDGHSTNRNKTLLAWCEYLVRFVPELGLEKVEVIFTVPGHNMVPIERDHGKSTCLILNRRLMNLVNSQSACLTVWQALHQVPRVETIYDIANVISSVRQQNFEFKAEVVLRYPDYRAVLDPVLDKPSFPINSSHYFVITAEGCSAALDHTFSHSAPQRLLLSCPLIVPKRYEGPQTLPESKRKAFLSADPKDGWQGELHHDNSKAFFVSVAQGTASNEYVFQSLWDLSVPPHLVDQVVVGPEREARRREGSAAPVSTAIPPPVQPVPKQADATSVPPTAPLVKTSASTKRAKRPSHYPPGTNF